MKILEDNEYRNNIIQILKSLSLPPYWKIVLDLNPDTEKIRLIFYKREGIKIKSYYLFYHWIAMRELEEFCYQDIYEKLKKYPFLLETETIIKCGNIESCV